MTRILLSGLQALPLTLPHNPPAKAQPKTGGGAA
jgi:hypothetical protein